MMEESPAVSSSSPSVAISNFKMCSLFNSKEYNSVINQHNIKISKFMRLNINNAQPIILQNVTSPCDFSKNLSCEKIGVDAKNEMYVDGSMFESATNSTSSPVEADKVYSIPDIKFCSFCNISFRDQSEQRQHYKLDWHRYNIKLNIKQKQLVTEPEFSSLMTKNEDLDNDDVSSISGSESDGSTDSDTDSSTQRLQPFKKQINDDCASAISGSGSKTRVIFENGNGNIVALYKCLFVSANKAESETLPESKYINMFNKLPITLPNSKSLVVMLGGGHFAAAVFKGAEPVLHKTFHCYTVRAKQGGSQSMKDNKRATGCKSAGASLRRYNEQSLLQHVQDILCAWSEEVKECKYIFYRAVGPGNRSILFGGRQPSLDKNDQRLSKIPFPTRRATFSEVKRVHSLLMSLYVYESEEIFANIFQLNNSVSSKQKQGDSVSCSPIKKKKEKDNEGGKATNKTNRASKQRQSPTRDNYDEKISDIVHQLKLESSSSSDEEDSTLNKNQYSNSLNDVSISFSEPLEEYGNTPVPKKRKKQKPKSPKSNNDNSNVGKEENNDDNGVCNKEIVEDVSDGDYDKKDENKFIKKKKKKKQNDKDHNVVEGYKNPLLNKLAKRVFLACFSGDVDSLKNSVNEYRSCQKEFSNETETTPTNKSEIPPKEDSFIVVFNQVTQDGLTLLQNAAKNSHKEIVRFLLENGGDPCARTNSMTAYDFAPDKDTRNVFRRFMGEFPDKYDYTKSHIPSPLSDTIEIEMALKRRALKKAKKQKEKERRIADEPRRQEEAEKKRYLELSDREKRALAAERRILAAVGKAANNLALVRCFQCAINITGKVPFEYDNKLFCTMDCLKAHRVLVKKNIL